MKEHSANSPNHSPAQDNTFYNMHGEHKVVSYEKNEK